MLGFDVHYGEVGKEVDWREHPDTSPDDDSDQPSDEVTRILGFDPKEVDSL